MFVVVCVWNSGVVHTLTGLCDSLSLHHVWNMFVVHHAVFVMTNVCSQCAVIQSFKSGNSLSTSLMATCSVFSGIMGLQNALAYCFDKKCYWKYDGYVPTVSELMLTIFFRYVLLF